MEEIDLLINRAIHEDVKAFSGNQMELSQLVCGSKQGLSHKINHFRGTDLYPDELIRLQQFSGSYQAMQEMARLLGGVFFRLPEMGNTDGAAALICIELGALHSAMLQARQAGVISSDERVMLERKAQNMIAAVFSWLYACFSELGGVNREATN